MKRHDAEQFKAKQRANAKPDTRQSQEAKRRRKHLKRAPKARRVEIKVLDAGGGFLRMEFKR